MTPDLSQRDFVRLAQLIEGHCGIKMPDGKRTMIEGRLRRRVRALALRDIGEYCDFLFDRGGLDGELVNLLDAITTNKTDFFREPDHFNFLAAQAVPALMRRGAGFGQPLRVWSAACSTGQEPYSIAMVLSDLAAAERGWRFVVRASDISTEVLEVALRGIYPAEQADAVPLELRRQYVLRARGKDDARMRVAPEIRTKVSFRRLNLIEGVYPWEQSMDIVFCRNVLIYFDRPTQVRVLEFLCRNILPGGWLFLGHSETLSGVSLPLRPVAPAVYQRQ